MQNIQTRDFNGQVAIVTGAGQGIGFEIAKELAVQGASVLLNDVDEVLLTKASAAIRSLGGNCAVLQGDASNLDFIQQMVDTAVAQFGKLTIAIANAGITLFGSFLDYPVESLQKVMSLNLQGSFYLAQRTARQIVKQKSGGSILFMSSATGHQAHADLAAYGMTKAGLEMLAKSLVVELSEFKITVNTVAPGATLTERTMEDSSYNDTWSELTPMGRPSVVQDIANAVLFLVSPRSQQITGQNIIIDGGWTSVSPPPKRKD